MLKFTSEQLFEWFCRLLGMAVASLTSPLLALLNLVLKPYVNLAEVFSSANPLSAYVQLILQFKQAGAETLLLVILPSMLACFLISCAYYYACTELAARSARFYLRSARMNSQA